MFIDQLKFPRGSCVNIPNKNKPKGEQKQPLTFYVVNLTHTARDKIYTQAS